jgi:hypothetical protein
MYLQKVGNKQKNTFFVGILSATGGKSRIRIGKSVVRTPGSGSVPEPKCHGFTTLAKYVPYSTMYVCTFFKIEPVKGALESFSSG